MDQYGKAMNYSSNRMTITATNLTKGLNMNPIKNSTTTNPYFTLSTSAASMSLGNDIAVVIALTSDPTVIKTANLTIDNIYTDSFEFGEVDLAGDAHAYVNQGNKYSLKYTATDTEGKAVLLSKTNALGATATVNNITFVSSNTNTINPANMKVDANGKLFFTTGSYASKVTLTAVNNVTGKTATIEIQVGASSKATKLEISDITVAKQNYTNTNTIGKADVVVYDQYGDIMKAADIAKLDISNSGLFNVVAGLGSVTATISDDGKYLVYKAGVSGFNASTSTLGVTYNVNFVSTVDATVTSIGKITIGEDSALASIQEVAAPDAVVVAGDKIKIKVKALDNYNSAQPITDATTKGAITGKGYIYADDPGHILTAEKYNNSADDVSLIELTTNAITEAFKSGSVRLVLVNADGEEVDSKTYNVVISKDATTYDVSTDKTVYTSGDKIAVTVKAMDATAGFLSKYKATVPVNISDGTKTYNKDLAFENGVATVEIPAISGNNITVTVTKAGAASVTGTKTGLTVNAAGAPAYLAITSSNVTAKDNADNSLTTYAGYKTATIKVTNAAGMDVTGDFCTAAGFSASDVDADGNITLNFTNGVAALAHDLTAVSASGNITAGSYVVTITIGSVSGKITASVA